VTSPSGRSGHVSAAASSVETGFGAFSERVDLAGDRDVLFQPLGDLGAFSLPTRLTARSGVFSIACLLSMTRRTTVNWFDQKSQTGRDAGAAKRRSTACRGIGRALPLRARGDRTIDQKSQTGRDAGAAKPFAVPIARSMTL